MKDNTAFVLIILFICVSAIGKYLSLEEDRKSEPCHYIGVTLIEYGVGVTNCGDTIPVKMPGDLYREFKEKQDE